MTIKFTPENIDSLCSLQVGTEFIPDSIRRGLRLRIDGKEVLAKPNQTVLEAALE